LYHDIVSNEEKIEFNVNYWNQITMDQQKQEQLEEHPLFKEKKQSSSICVSSQSRPLMIVGKDEGVFAQYLLGSKTWLGPKGQCSLLPKSKGDGRKLSAFVSREFDVGQELTIAE
jgi:hypothetical protein